MKEKLQIVQQMEELAVNIKRIEKSLDATSREGAEYIDSISIQYSIPNERNYSGNGVKEIIKDIKFPIPDGVFADKIAACIRQAYEESLKECYSRMEGYADKLKDMHRIAAE